MTDNIDTRSRLQEMLESIVQELETIAVYESTSDTWVVAPDKTGLRETDENAEADAFEETEERQATLASLETSYRDIKRALDKIEAGTYGICEISGEPIEGERLSVLPTARTCKAHRDEEQSLPI